MLCVINRISQTDEKASRSNTHPIHHVNIFVEATVVAIRCNKLHSENNNTRSLKINIYQRTILVHVSFLSSSLTEQISSGAPLTISLSFDTNPPATGVLDVAVVGESDLLEVDMVIYFNRCTIVVFASSFSQTSSSKIFTKDPNSSTCKEM